MYNYIKALHIIFIVTWFSGMFYIVRLFIYHAEAQDLQEPGKTILSGQYKLMIRRLWIGITWPSAILTLVFGGWTWWLMGSLPGWLLVKLFFVLGLYGYHLSLHFIYRQQSRNRFRFSSEQLRIWNEVATLFLFLIIFLAVAKGTLNWIRLLTGLVVLIVLLMTGIKVYRRIRLRSPK